MRKYLGGVRNENANNRLEAQKKTQRAKEYIKSNLSLEREVEKYERLLKIILRGKAI